jgi:aspartyl-tRNA(Asn)/glutamyl-tRNA(Gln) amidotransferase subunit B
MRSKEEAQDYRYFPDPDLPPLRLDESFVAEVRDAMPELPEAKRRRFIDALGLTPYAAQVLTVHPGVAAFFEAAATVQPDAPPGAPPPNPTKVANFIQSEVLGDVQTHGLEAKIPVSSSQVAALLGLVDARTISGKQAKDVYAAIAGTDESPAAAVARLGMQQVSDAGALEALCKRLIGQNPKQAEQLRAGKASLTGYFVGLAMKETKGAANPQLVNELLKKLLGPG